MARSILTGRRRREQASDSSSHEPRSRAARAYPGLVGTRGVAARLSDWISPLLHTPGYQPTAIGIRVARPHVSLLTAVADPDRLRALTRDVRIRPRVPRALTPFDRSAALLRRQSLWADHTVGIC